MSAGGGDLPFVSVVVPTSNRVDSLRDCLEALRGQDYPRDRYEVLVIHNGETAAPNGPPAGDADSPAIRHLALSVADANSARNLGISAALGDPICLVDDDVLAPEEWLRALVMGLLRNPDAECAGGPVRPAYEQPPPRTCHRHDLASEVLDHGAAETVVGEVWGGNMAIRRGAVSRIGRFREGLVRSQEWEWQQRLLARGGSIVYIPAASLSHRRRAGDLQVGTLILDAFRRGYFVGRLRPRRAGWLLAPRVGVALAHAGRRQCVRGLTDASRRAGELLGTIVGVARRIP